MFLEDSTVGREVLKEECTTLLSKVADLIPVIMSDEAARNELLCYQTVKVKTWSLFDYTEFARGCSESWLHQYLLSQVCLQVFQLLPVQVAPLVLSKDIVNTSVRDIVEFLMNIILGEVGACGKTV